MALGRLDPSRVPRTPSSVSGRFYRLFTWLSYSVTWPSRGRHVDVTWAFAWLHYTAPLGMAGVAAPPRAARAVAAGRKLAAAMIKMGSADRKRGRFQAPHESQSGRQVIGKYRSENRKGGSRD